MLAKSLLSQSSRSLRSAAAVRSKHSLPDLPYDYNALEPHVSSQIMQLHHSGHHATYVNALNTAEEQLAEAVSKSDVKQAITLQKAVNFNGGGHLNHSLFWTGLVPEKQGGGDVGSGELKKAIDRDFGSVDQLKKDWTTAALGIQGSGWAWLGLDPKTKKLAIVTTANQDPLLSHTPLLGIDMWWNMVRRPLEPYDFRLSPDEAFYLQHLNKKPPYLDNIWKVLNFKEAEKRLSAA